MAKKITYPPKTEYQKLLLSPNWQRKRLEILNRDQWSCQSCGNPEETLHVHHRVYHFDKKPWEYDNDLLVTLCSICHEEETLISKHLPKEFFDYLMQAGLLPSHLNNIMSKGIDIKFSYAPEVVASIIGFFLSYRPAQLLVEEMFWESINNNKEEIVESSDNDGLYNIF